MDKSSNSLMKWLGATALLALTGCGTMPTEVKEANANPDAFLAKNYTLQALRPGYVDTLKSVGAPGPTNFKEITFKLEYRHRALGAATDAVTTPQLSYRPLGNGFFQQIRTLENNGFLVNRSFILSFLGVLTLKKENASPQSKMTVLDGAVKDIKPFKFEPAKLTEPGSKLVVDFATGFPMQEFNFRWNKMACTTVKAGSAAELHPKIKGQAIWFDCEGTSEVGAPSKGSSVYLSQYGVMMQTKFADSRYSGTEVITDFTEQ
ncbi:hypothetical protein CKY39_19665 [Variovorax boronicumulans]|uniref:Lipoprotein n=1 Tax=Variovorax boronicumulans TaxID=436515 RepID=A0A250DM25_9BURK|nr:hypothetical protein [Variovorax boronicumulans]ATA55181.1 hypothetical protein CKY39_19665 [Variovorax boronicumulans]